MEPRRRGSSRRSISESGRHSSMEGNDDNPPDSPGLKSEFNLDRSISNPDLNYLRENIVESPMGLGLGTRLQARQSESKAEKLARTLQRIEYLKMDVEGWAGLCVDSPPDNLTIILKNYDQLQARRKVVAREALLRGAELSVVREIEGLGTRMDNLKRLAEKKAQRRGSVPRENFLPQPPQVEDEVFTDREELEYNVLSPTPPQYTPGTQVELDQEINSPFHQTSDEPIAQKTPEPGNAYPGINSMTASVEKIIASFRGARRAAESGELSDDREDMIEQIVSSIQEVGNTLVTRRDSDNRSKVEGLEIRYKQVEDQLGNHSTKLSNIETLCGSIQDSVERMKINISEIESTVSQVKLSQNGNRDKIEKLESKVGAIDRNIKTYISHKLAPLQDQTHSRSLTQPTSQITHQVENTIQSSLEKYCDALGLGEIRKDLSEIKERNMADERTVETLRDLVVEVRDQVSRNPLSANVSRYAHTSTPNPPDPTQSNRECEVIKSSIERSIRLIRQLTETKLTLGSDVGLIKKCNKEDTGKVNRYVKACGDDLLRYVKYPEADQAFCDEIRNILGRADDWVVHVESIYARSEAHAISDARGDITKIGVFANNAEKTVFEFIEETDLGMLGWGTSKQRASLLCKHLSEEIISRIADFSDDFSKIRKWLIKTYGRADRIIGDILKGLAIHQPPPPCMINLRGMHILQGSLWQ